MTYAHTKNLIYMKMYDEAFVTLHDLANAGNTNAMYDLALCYDMGFGTNKTPVMARHWYKRAYSPKHWMAMNNLGASYEEAGFIKEAIEAYTNAIIEHGCTHAKKNLAYINSQYNHKTEFS